MIKSSITIALVLSAFLLQAQNISSSNIRWNSGATKLENQTTAERTYVLTFGRERIEWKNDDGSLRASFQIVEMIGEWTDVASTGTIQCEVTDGRNSATLTITKKSSGTTISIAIASNPPKTYELFIETTQLL